MRFLLSILLLGAAVAPAQKLRVGAAEVVITPPLGMPMDGYYSTRLMKGVHDDLHAKAIVMASGDEQAALIACDLVAIPAAVIDEARQLIQAETGIPGSRVMISATLRESVPPAQEADK